MWAWPPCTDEDPFGGLVRKCAVVESKESEVVFEKPRIKTLEGRASTLRRVDYYLGHMIQGLLSDGELTLARINVSSVVDKAEELAWEAMNRAARMADLIIEGKGPDDK